MLGGAAIVGLDWGSSSLRAFLMDEAGTVLSERSSVDGASRITGGPLAFEQALQAIAGDWIDAYPGIRVIACGMVGSKHGWKEAPYVPCPLDLGELAKHASHVETLRGIRVNILPGVLWKSGASGADVMRGEEVQVAGLLADHPTLADSCRIVLPGTHSKWVTIEGGNITCFSTHMTGELYAVLREHSVLGRLMPVQVGFNSAGFDEGVGCAFNDGGWALSKHLFTVRARSLLGQLAENALSDYLSGLLIGHELACALRDVPEREAIALVGDPMLCLRYRRALTYFNRKVRIEASNTASRGLWHFSHGKLLSD